MHFPVYIRLGPWSLHPHFVLEALAYQVAGLLYLYLRRLRGDIIAVEARWAVVAAAALGAAAGSRLLSAFEDPHHLTLAGKTIVGGLIGGTIAVEWIKRRLRVTTRTGDLFALPLCIGITIGRIGCFLTGDADDTVGLPTNLPWGADFGDGVRRHPTQLYEIVFVLVLAAVVWLVMRQIAAPTGAPKVSTTGDAFRVFMIGYMSWRVAVDFLKPGFPLLGLTALQWAAAATVIWYARDAKRWVDALAARRPIREPRAPEHPAIAQSQLETDA